MFSYYFHIAEANMLYLETPVGVGFSYSSDTPYVTVDDKITGIFLGIWKLFFQIFLCWSLNLAFIKTFV